MEGAANHSAGWVSSWLPGKKRWGVVYYVVLLSGGLLAWGDQKVWKQTTGGPWETSTSWEPAGVPSGLDEAVVPSLVQGFNSIILSSDVGVAGVTSGRNFFVGPGWLTAQKVTLADTFFTTRSEDLLSQPRRVIIGEEGLLNGTVRTSRMFVNQGITTNFGTLAAVRATEEQLLIEEVPRWVNESQSELWLVPPLQGVSFQEIPINPAEPPPPPIAFAAMTNEVNALIGLNFPRVGTINWALINRGAIRVEQGELVLEKAVELDGRIHVAAGARVTVRSSRTVQSVIKGGLQISGAGPVRFVGNADHPFLVESPMTFFTPVIIESANLDGASLDFRGPVTWNFGGTNDSPVFFRATSIGNGSFARPIFNFGIATNDGIVPNIVGATWNNMPFSHFIVTDRLPPSGPKGLFTNHFLASMDLSAARLLTWNIANFGLIQGPAARDDVTLFVRGNLMVGETGELLLQNGEFNVTNEFISAGLISGNGMVASRVLQISGRIAPHSPNSAFGRIALTGQSGEVNTNTVFQMDLGDRENDSVHLEATLLGGRIDLRALSGFGPGIYRLATYRAGTRNRFQLGSVPPGYRFALVDDMAAREIRLIVSQPASQTVSLKSKGDGGFALDLATLTNAAYRIDFTTDLAKTWTVWTNLNGNGQIVTLERPTLTPSGFFRVMENSLTP